MSLRSAIRQIAQVIAVARGPAHAWVATNAYLVAFLLLLAASGLLVIAMRDSASRVRDPDSVLVLGMIGKFPSDEMPAVSVKQDDDEGWWVSISAVAEPGWTQTFVISTKRQIARDAICFDTGERTTVCTGTTNLLLGSIDPILATNCTASIVPTWKKPITHLSVIELWSKLQRSTVRSIPGGNLARQYDTFQITVPAVLRVDDDGHPIRYTLECHAEIRPMHDSWTDRSIQIWCGSGTNEESVDVDLSDLARHPSLAVVGGDPSRNGLPEYQRISANARDVLTLRWRDEDAAWLRDVVLLTIGALLGIAGACIVEWARPWFQRITRHGT